MLLLYNPHQTYSILTEVSCYKTFSKESERDVMYYALLEIMDLPRNFHSFA
jgi:hypothetical protein